MEEREGREGGGGSGGTGREGWKKGRNFVDFFLFSDIKCYG